MVEHNAGPGDQEGVNKSNAVPGWRTTLMTIGFFSILVALFIGASMKESAGAVPKYLAFGALALFVICGVSALIDRISHRGSRGPQTTH